MRQIILPTVFITCFLLAGCSSSPPAVVTNQSSNSAAKSAPQGSGQGGADASNLGVVPSHGDSAQSGGTSSGEKPSVATPELDAKIEKAAAKAKAPGASESDKKAAAKAYFDRADYYREQGLPVLYKFALADYRRGLRLDSSNEDARAKMDEIVSIYQSMDGLCRSWVKSSNP